MLSRRTFLKGFLALSAAGALVGGYALAEPFRLRVTRYQITPPKWPRDLKLKFAVIADLHAVNPWMSLERVRTIVARTNAINPDAILLLGDYVPSAGMKRWASRVPRGSAIADHAWANALAKLKAPLGTHAVLGNHDWWEDPAAQKAGHGPVHARGALEAAGIPVYENDAIRLVKDKKPFWLAGLGDQIALIEPGRGIRGVDDLATTMAKVNDSAPVILLAHEPDIFARLGNDADRISLTISGHTHGGQVRLFGYSPIVPSRYGSRYAYGHIVENDCNMVVSGGLGCSIFPVRFGVPPEIVVIDLGGTTA